MTLVSRTDLLIVDYGLDKEDKEKQEGPRKKRESKA